LTELRLDPGVREGPGVDWYWVPSIVHAVMFLIRERPAIVVFQWWTGTVLHSYIALAIIARLVRARVLIEFHEVLDSGEARIPLVRWYVAFLAPLLMWMASGFVIHSESDRLPVQRRFRISRAPIITIPHGPYDHHVVDREKPLREAPAGACNLLFFGVIRPFKGLEDLVAAFDAIPEDEIRRYWLTVVGEIWEGWYVPAQRMAASRYRDRITVVERYVPDSEVTRYFAGADVVVLPYHRSSASGPLQVAMSRGLPVVVTSVGGLPEAVRGYEGAVLVAPRDPLALLEGIRRASVLTGVRYADPHSWDDTAQGYRTLAAGVAR